MTEPPIDLLDIEVEKVETLPRDTIESELRELLTDTYIATLMRVAARLHVLRGLDSHATWDFFHEAQDAVRDFATLDRSPLGC